MLKATEYALWPVSVRRPCLSVAVVIWRATGAADSAKNMIASKKERSVTNLAESVVCSISPGRGSLRNPAVAVIRTIFDNCTTGTLANSATSVVDVLPRKGTSASI